jgi:hypothetical protein
MHELQYFRYTAGELAPLDKPSPMVTVLLESFLIHLRNLIDFLHTPRVKEEDDVIASDFCPGWSETMSSTLKAAKERANKELSHLTLERKSAHDPSKPWDVAGLFYEVSDVAKRFAAKASPTKLSPEVPKWLGVNYGTITVAVFGNMTTSSNTTSTMTVTSFGGAPPSNNTTHP